jgi:AcrR family transcriptional regulator
VAAEQGLRERKKERTRQLLLETARRLFSERGYEHVSIAEIAGAAEVSEATIYNYFASKEELVFSGLERFEAALLAAIRERPAGETVLAAFSRFILEPVTGFLVEEDETAAQQRMQMTRTITSSPLLLAHEQRLYARYTSALAQLLAAETRAGAGDLRP